MIWARMLAYITGTVDQELLLRTRSTRVSNGTRCHKNVILMVVNGGKMRTKGEQRRRKGFIGFSRNLLISSDYGQLRQVLMKLVVRLLTEGSQRPRSIGVGCTPFLPSVVGCIGTHRWSICAAHRSRNILGTYLASSEIRKRNQNNDLD